MDSLDTVNVVIQAVIGFGTVGALIAAFYQIRSNKKQFDDEKARASDLENKAQAANIASWFEQGRLPPSSSQNPSHTCPQEILIRNASLLPVYDVVLTVVGQHGAGPLEAGEKNSGDFDCRIMFSQLPCGLWGQWIPTHGGGMGVITTIEMAFTDSKGNSWVRRGNGNLEKLPVSPLKFYEIPLPCHWSTPIRIGD